MDLAETPQLSLTALALKLV